VGIPRDLTKTIMFTNLQALYQVMRDARLDRSAMNKVVDKRLKNVLINAYLHVPYYRTAMDSAKYNPIREYRGPQDLTLLPVVTKKDLKEHGMESFLRKGVVLRECFRDATSGSTGIPLVIYRSQYERSVQIAKWLRVLFANGYRITQKVMSLSPPWRLMEGRTVLNKAKLLRKRSVNYHSSASDMVDAFLEYKPDVLYGNRTHIDMMASELERRGIHYEDLRVLAVAAEVVPENCRKLCLKHFGIRLTEIYGSTEMGTMFHETPEHNGLHIMEDLTHCEFVGSDLRPVDPGEPGRTVVTDLVGTTMPFIRYDQGDIAIYEDIKSETGGIQRRVRKIVGRDDDYAVLPDGSRRTFHLFYEVMDNYEKLVQFRVVQKSRDLFEIQVATNENYLESIRGDMLTQLHDRFSRDIAFDIVRVDGIEPDPSGKIRMLISEV